ncbi:MAG: 4Fe-4S dicluster domain-containing protein [Chloroflexi bacterium]|nr:4Fe-4S dicluster domain-containing protein [Chloroflexota bacterium]
MLTSTEKIIFVIAALVTAYFVISFTLRIARVIGRGHGKPDWSLLPKRAFQALTKTVLLTPVWRVRHIASIFHGFVVWGFSFYLLVNIGDVLEGFIPDFHFLGTGMLGELYRLGADVLSVGVLVGMAFLLVRRFITKDPLLSTRETTLTHPKAHQGKQRDSLIVGVFILMHVGARFVGETFQIASEGQRDTWQPFASIVSGLWSNLNPETLDFSIHVSFWLALGLIMLFFPYFMFSKHIHLFFAPLNFLLSPERTAPGELEALDFEDESIEQFGATRLEDLGWHQIMDAYACIMCNRCQDVCPAYTTGKVLSPAALEINKRYFINQESKSLAAGKPSSQTLLEFAITEEAVFACTACGACTDICPVGNDPMRDIMDIRRAMVLMDNKFPEQWQTAFRGMERLVNPWNIPPTERMAWAEGLNVPTVEQNPDAEILWWVGCAPATDARAQKTAVAFTEILNKAGVNFAVLGQQEQCTGDSARRAGNEYLFFELANANVEILNQVAPKRIVTTCPHCLHTLDNEYPSFGGNYEVIHHTELIDELSTAGKLKLKEGEAGKITFHDPCYLGRQNGVFNQPRSALSQAGGELLEMKRKGKNSFCCGAGGAQMWKEEEHGTETVKANRFSEAEGTGAETLAVGCPFCMLMLTDASKDAASDMQVMDVAEIVAQKLED